MEFLAALVQNSEIEVHYPYEYLRDFNHPDEEVVQRYIDYLNMGETKDEVQGLIISKTGRNQTETVVYIVKKFDKVQPVPFQINWAQPGKKPGEYQEYARGDTMFHVLSGSYEVQKRRANMLAERINCTVVELTREEFRDTVNGDYFKRG